MLFQGEKLLYKLNDIKYINIPKLDELSVPKILELIKDDVEMKKYYPDEYFDKKIPDRAFFYNTLNTKYPGFLASLVSHAQS